ncbi:MAG: hypothetical protein Unbinned6284contig1004_10 [Prokaryotic dsDNA virus sp.]|nr:MAG: hypothetical protein Unbinned6284contig1004_10 [Prokaryotic dsDNA virus sp.]|tara:strand:+ start:27154 stop:27282 length:129 start_codon:yes stop_codon:yes gene_type:complete
MSYSKNKKSDTIKRLREIKSKDGKEDKKVAVRRSNKERQMGC